MFPVLQIHGTNCGSRQKHSTGVGSFASRSRSWWATVPQITERVQVIQLVRVTAGQIVASPPQIMGISWKRFSLGCTPLRCRMWLGATDKGRNRGSVQLACRLHGLLRALGDQQFLVIEGQGCWIAGSFTSRRLVTWVFFGCRNAAFFGLRPIGR